MFTFLVGRKLFQKPRNLQFHSHFVNKTRNFSLVKEWNCNRYFPDSPHKLTNENPRKNEALIVVNTTLPPFFKPFWKEAKLTICADGGANRLYDFFSDEEERRNFIPDLIKGDFDSIRDPVKEYYSQKGSEVVEDKEQESTDLEKCLESVAQNWRVVILGGLEGNFTQSLANLNSLFHSSFVLHHEPVLLDRENVAFILSPGKHLLHCPRATKVGLIPLGKPCNSISTKGLKWNLDHSKLAFGHLISSSNEMERDYVEIEVSDPILWTCDFRK